MRGYSITIATRELAQDDRGPVDLRDETRLGRGVPRPGRGRAGRGHRGPLVADPAELALHLRDREIELPGDLSIGRAGELPQGDPPEQVVVQEVEQLPAALLRQHEVLGT